MHSISELNNSTSLRSVRERKRPGAKTSRGPAFIFGNKAGAEPKNDIELRFVLVSRILKSELNGRGHFSESSDSDMDLVSRFLGPRTQNLGHRFRRGQALHACVRQLLGRRHEFFLDFWRLQNMEIFQPFAECWKIAQTWM